MKFRSLLLFTFLCSLAFSQEKTAFKAEAKTLQVESIHNLKANKELSNRREAISAVRENRTENTNYPEQERPGISSLQISDQADVYASPFESVRGKRELTSKRDMFSKTYDNGDGSYTALIGAGPIHYEKNGQFLDIDHSITVNFDQSYPYVNASNFFQSYFGNSSSIGVKNKTADGEIREFLSTKMYWEVNGQPHGLINSANVPVQVEGEKAYYRNIYGSIAAEFTILTGKRELNYIIPNRQALGVIPENAKYLVFSEDVVLPLGWTHHVTDEGILINNTLGQPIYLYTNPVSTDDGYNSTLLDENNTVYKTRLSGNSLTILTMVKVSWLLDNTRQFPVRVDPTNNYYPNNMNMWTGYAINNDTNSDGGMRLGRYYQSSRFGGNWREARPFIRIDISNIPNGAVVSNARGWVYRTGHSSSPGINARFQFYSCNNPENGGNLYGSMSQQLSQNNNGTGNNGERLNSGQWKYADLSANAGIPYLQTAITNNTYFAVGMVKSGNWNSGNNDIYVSFTGRGGRNTNRPYFSITYTVGSSNCKEIQATADKPVICSGENVILSATSETNGYNYTWYTDWNSDTHTGIWVGNGANITVNPTESTLYGVVATKSGCPTGYNAAYDLITIAVTPPPSLLVTDPVEAITCSDEFKKLEVTGGVIPEVVMFEDFDPYKYIWLSRTNGGLGGHWGTLESGAIGIDSPDNSRFMITGSWFSGLAMYSELYSPPISLLDYDTPINLTFNHLFWTDGYSTATVRVSTDGGLNWDNLATYNSDQNGATLYDFKEGVTFNLDAYAGEPYLLLMFDYVSTNRNDWFWALDDIKITGSPKATDFEWTPYSGLYLDAAGTPYNGEDILEVYASPSTTTTYTVTSSTAVGCPSKATVTVTQGDKEWRDTSNTSWNRRWNWVGDTVPTAEHCVKIPQMDQSSWPIISNTQHGLAKNITVESGGGLTINNGGSLTVGEFIKNNSSGADNFIVKDGGNLIQLDSEAENTGKITTEHYINNLDNNFPDAYDYVYWSSPVSGQGIVAFSPGTPPDADDYGYLDYNEEDDFFYNTEDTEFLAAKGYAIGAETTGPGITTPKYNKTYKFEGVPHNGKKEIELSLKGNGYNLVGNPYPSNINANVFFDMNGGEGGVIDKKIWLWTNNDPIPYQEGEDYEQNNYAVYSASGGNPATTSAGGGSGSGQMTNTPNGYIRSGQGFIVKAKVHGGDLVFDNKNLNDDKMLRVTNSEAFYHKDFEDRFWLTLTSPSEVINTTLVGYFEEATDAYDPDYDAEFWGSSDAIYSIIPDWQLIIQGRKSPFDLNDVVQLGANFYQDGVYVISLKDPEGTFASTRVYLVDKELGYTHNLSKEPYKFFTLSGTNNNRFEIRYRHLGFSTSADNNFITAAKQNEDIIILSTSENIREVQLYDIIGMQIYSNLKVNDRELRIPASRWMNSILFAKIITADGEVTTTKVLLK